MSSMEDELKYAETVSADRTASHERLAEEIRTLEEKMEYLISVHSLKVIEMKKALTEKVSAVKKSLEQLQELNFKLKLEEQVTAATMDSDDMRTQLDAKNLELNEMQALHDSQSHA